MLITFSSRYSRSLFSGYFIRMFFLYIGFIYNSSVTLTFKNGSRSKISPYSISSIILQTNGRRSGAISMISIESFKLFLFFFDLERDLFCFDLFFFMGESFRPLAALEAAEPRELDLIELAMPRTYPSQYFSTRQKKSSWGP